MFTPEEIIFAPTARCNLHCAHCRVSRHYAGTLDAQATIAFLRSAAPLGVTRVGFSGGEPFLVPQFLLAVCTAAVDADMLFDRLMTNGVWYKDRRHLAETLQAVAEAGFDGIIGLSADHYHGSTASKLVPFIEEVFKAFGRQDCLDISGVLPPGGNGQPSDFQLYEELASGLGAILLKDHNGRPIAITDGSKTCLDGEALHIPVNLIPYSSGAAEDAWGAAEWFADDWCAGPGHVFFVHPDGSVASCCGFSNERPELIMGSIYESDAQTLLEKARAMPLNRAAYIQGLGEKRKELESQGVTFPGKTADMCFFCDWLCEKGLMR